MRVALHKALWGAFKNCTVDINTDIDVLTENVVDIISTTTDMQVPKGTVKIYVNQKPWINKNTRNALKHIRLHINQDWRLAIWMITKQQHTMLER
jgi:hypothetical protein